MQQRAIERTGGRPGIRDVNQLEAVLNRPHASFSGSEIYPTLAMKAAVLVYSLVTDHLFYDGNKRMGLLCLDVFLRLNGVGLKATVEERYDFVVESSSETPSMEGIARWIEAHIGPAPVKAPPPAPARSARPTATRRLVIPSPPGPSSGHEGR